jgi:diguanylate cyclase (GGDEF)-like protein/PAS domain S-box-containing protein
LGTNITTMKGRGIIPWVLIIAAISAGMLALSVTLLLHRRANENERCTQLLASLEAQVANIALQGMTALHDGELPLEKEFELNAARQHARSQLNALSMLPPAETWLFRIRAAYNSHSVWLSQQLNLLLAGKAAAARRDQGRGQSFTVALRSEIRHAAERSAADAASSKRAAEIGTFLAIGFALSVFVGLGALFARNQSESAQVAAAQRASREGEERLRCLLEFGNNLTLVTDAAGSITYCGPSAQQVLGHRPETLIGRPLIELSHPDDAALLGRGLMQARNHLGPQSAELRLLDSYGDVRSFEVVCNSRIDDPRVAGIVVNCWDVTGRLQAELALRESEERYALAARGANDGLWDWDLIQNRVYFSPRWKTMLGYAEDEIGTDPDEWFDRLHPADLLRVQNELQSHIEGRIGHFQCEYRLFHRNGCYKWLLCRGIAVVDEGRVATRFVGSQTDITDRKEAEARLEHAALHDELTGLPNRLLLRECLNRAVQRARRGSNFVFAVLYLDLDRFKNINDSLGHLVGDRLLVAVARRLTACVRPGDTVARLGGDEFAILLEDLTSIDDATIVADRIHKELRYPFDLDGYEVFTSTSIGIASNALSHQRLDDMLRDADNALYEAKSLGKGQYALFDAGMHARVIQQLELENDLRRAVEREEFVVHYQPQVSLETGKIEGLEALARWYHPDRGLVSPTEFVPAAEENGLIYSIGRCVLAMACCQMRRWQDTLGPAAPLTVSVNVSAKQLNQQGFVESVEAILQETNLSPHCLLLEVTETTMVSAPEHIAGLLTKIRSRGVQIAIDDFGTGYSSLSSLHQLHFDALKIDRSFLKDSETDPAKWELVRTIISLARGLRMKVVAEGVETEAQLERLRAGGCDYAQGYFISAPVEPLAATRLLREAVFDVAREELMALQGASISST